MSTVLAVMDRPGWGANTDNIVVAYPRSRRLVWVPRDLWVDVFGKRVNGLYARVGADGLLWALRAAGVRADHVVCLEREAAETLLADVEVEVEVREPLRFWYPLSPQSPLEEGRKEVSFDPPSERLSGERIHQWLGARLGADDHRGGDFARIARQQAFASALLSQGFSAAGLLTERPDLFKVSDERAIAELAGITPAWRMTTLGGMAPMTIRGRKVLLRRRLPGPLGDLELKRHAARLGGRLD